jgi:hypothetical protein
MTLVRVELIHTDKKPRTTIIVINGVDMFEVRTFSSDLTFIQEKISKSTGKSTSAEYLFDVEWREP